MPGGWNFAGGCATGPIGPGGATFRIDERHGIAVAIAFGSTDTERAVPFVVGVALGRDVSGVLNGRTAFPHYRSVPCLDARKRPVACAGLAALYLAIINTGDVTVNFDATPVVEIRKPGFFRGARSCALDTLVPMPGRTGAFAWTRRTPPVSPARDRVLFHSVPTRQVFPSGGAFSVFAAVCRR